MNQTTSYHGVHRKLERRYGFAKEHSCVECGGPATGWAFDHNDPDPLYGPDPNGVVCVYSCDLDRYQPMCSQCHTRLDIKYKTAPSAYEVANAARRAATHCKRGHEFTEQSIYVKTNGTKQCLICKNAYAKAYDKARRGGG